MAIMRIGLALVLSVVAGAAYGADGDVKDYAYFLNRLIDLDGLAVLEEGTQTKQFSSYDQRSKYDAKADKYIEWDANSDRGQYVRVDETTGEAVMAEMDGPGCIWRIWSANPEGKIRFYLDGAEKPTYEWDFNDLFVKGKSPFPSPLIWQRRIDEKDGDNPASNCYMPIPFAKSCKVTADKAHRQYYHIGYSVYPKDWKVKTFTLERTPAEEAVLKKVLQALADKGVDPQPVEGMVTITHTDDLLPGQPVVVRYDEGPGVIRQFCSKVVGPERWVLRKVLLQIYFDGESKPSVEAPIGDFFGDAWAESPYKSLPMGITDEMNYCYFRMPFAKSVRIVVTNQGAKAARWRCKIAYQKGAQPENAGRFHARWRRDMTSKVFDYPVLECTGQGRFVGCVLFPDNITGGWWGEGDEKIYVDGEKFPSTFGTGSEDYFGDAWGIRYFANAFHGCPGREQWDKGRRQSCYRWHVSDSIPFARSFKIAMENYSALNKGAVHNDYSSMAYWYQSPDGKDFFETAADVAGRIPQGPVQAGAVEAEAVLRKGDQPGVGVVDDDELPEQLAGCKGVQVAGKAGTTAKFVLQIPREGAYILEAEMAGGVKASSYELLRDGKVFGDHALLPAGDLPITLRLTGQPIEGNRCEVVADFFVLKPYRAFVRDWYLAGPFDNTEKKGVDHAYGPEAEPFDAAKQYEGVNGQVAWKKIHVRDEVVTSLGDYFKRNDNIVVYGYVEVESPDDREVTAYVGSDDGVKVFVNGQLVHANPVDRGMRIDEDSFKVSLKKGRNAVLVKLLQGGGTWGFAFRLDDPKDELKYVLP